MSKILNLVHRHGVGLRVLGVGSPLDGDCVRLRADQLAQVGDVQGAGGPARLRAGGSGQRVGKGLDFPIYFDNQGLGKCISLFARYFRQRKAKLHLLSVLYATIHHLLRIGY